MNRGAVIIAGILLATMFTLELMSSLQESQTWDEAVHLAAGVSYWKTGDVRMNPEHPPLLKLLSAFPVLFTNPRVPVEQASWEAVNEWGFSDVFLYENTISPQTLLFLGRLPVMVLSIFLGWWIFRASSEMFGPRGGVLSVSLYALDPNVIAHSRYITTDLAFTALAFLSIYRLHHVLQRPTARNGVLFLASLLSASLMKFSAVVLLLGVIVACVIVRYREPKHAALRGRTLFRWLTIGALVALLMTWGLYAFDVRSPASDPHIGRLYTKREAMLKNVDPATLSPLDRFAVVTLGDTSKGVGKRLVELGQFKVPGYTYFRGLIAVLGHVRGGHASYLLGQTDDQGWWYYFPVVFVAKTPLPTIVALIGLVLLIAKYTTRTLKKDSGLRVLMAGVDRRWILFGVFPVIYFAVSMMGNLNLGWRHLMPIYPFLFILSGSLAALRARTRPLFTLSIPLLLIANIAIVQAGAYPHELGYFSPLVGGTRQGPRILLDSNLDWGQDLPKLAAYVRRRGITSLPFDYYGRARVHVYVPQAIALPTTEDVQQRGEPSGTIAVSVGQLFRPDSPYMWLWSKQPKTIVGSSIFIYELSEKFVD